MARRNILNFPDPVLAKNLRKLVAEKNLTQKQLASCCGKERKAYLNWLNEYTSPSAWDLKQICITYGVSADEMLGLKVRESERNDNSKQGA